ncbi:MAG TPA: hypothetical protein VNT33_15475, partial [Telluria sp.]|nr:hypothetical protein [Telluria sp.]
VLSASAFGPNTALPFTMRVGPASAQFKLGPVTQDVALQFSTDGQQRALEIEVPQPVAPKDVSQSIDVRKLGISLTRIEINAVAPEALSAR